MFAGHRDGMTARSTAKHLLGVCAVELMRRAGKAKSVFALAHGWWRCSCPGQALPSSGRD